MIRTWLGRRQEGSQSEDLPFNISIAVFTRGIGIQRDLIIYKMKVLRNLFEGYPNLWGSKVVHSTLILSLVVVFGIIWAKTKVWGISLGVTWLFFVGKYYPYSLLSRDCI